MSKRVSAFADDPRLSVSTDVSLENSGLVVETLASEEEAYGDRQDAGTLVLALASDKQLSPWSGEGASMLFGNLCLFRKL